MTAAYVLLHVFALTGAPALQPPAESKPPPEGIWPTEQMIESMVRRTALEAAERYELTEDQHRQIERQMVDRWQTFLRDNRAELQPLVNEYFEARLSVEPPTKSRMQAWAQRALRLGERIRGHVEAGNREIRERLDPLQRVKFDSESLAMKASLDGLHDRLGQWARGDFDVADVWDQPPSYKARVSDGGNDELSPPAAKPDQTELELDRWDVYVANFIATHGLDEGQQRAATSILREVKDRARAHRDRYRRDIEEMEVAIASGRAEDQAKVEAQLERLYAPIDELFAELRERLHRIPTETQRRTATQPAVNSSPAK